MGACDGTSGVSGTAIVGGEDMEGVVRPRLYPQAEEVLLLENYD